MHGYPSCLMYSRIAVFTILSDVRQSIHRELTSSIQSSKFFSLAIISGVSPSLFSVHSTIISWMYNILFQKWSVLSEHAYTTDPRYIIGNLIYSVATKCPVKHPFPDKSLRFKQSKLWLLLGLSLICFFIAHNSILQFPNVYPIILSNIPISFNKSY